MGVILVWQNDTFATPEKSLVSQMQHPDHATVFDSSTLLLRLHDDDGSDDNNYHCHYIIIFSVRVRTLTARRRAEPFDGRSVGQTDTDGSIYVFYILFMRLQHALTSLDEIIYRRLIDVISVLFFFFTRTRFAYCQSDRGSCSLLLLVRFPGPPSLRNAATATAAATTPSSTTISFARPKNLH